MAPNNATPRCARFEITGGPDLSRIGASYIVRFESSGSPRTAVQFKVVASSVSYSDVRTGRETDVALFYGADWYIDALMHEDGTGHEHLFVAKGVDSRGVQRFVTGQYSTGRRSGTIVLWDRGVTPPVPFAMSDGEMMSRVVPHGS